MLKYKKRIYKYVVTEDISVPHPLLEGYKVDRPYYNIKDGVATAKEGYHWDGASGPTIDTPNTMLPSLIHDIFYQSIRAGAIPSEDRITGDKILYDLLIQEGMSKLRAKLWYFFVSKFAGYTARK